MKSTFDSIMEDYTNQFKIPPYEDPGIIENPELGIGDACYIEYHDGADNKAGKYIIAKIVSNIITCDPMFDVIGDRIDTTSTVKDGEVLDATSNNEPQKNTLEFNRKDIAFMEPHEGDNLKHYIIIFRRDPTEKFFVKDRIPGQTDKDANKADVRKPKDTEPAVKTMVSPDTGIKTDKSVADKYRDMLRGRK